LPGRRVAWCSDPESYAGGTVATGRATLAGQVTGEHPDRERYTGAPGWGLGRWTGTSSPDKTNTHVNKPRQPSECQWEDRKKWSVGVGQRRETF
jgi:hypothetical protein